MNYYQGKKIVAFKLVLFTSLHAQFIFYLFWLILLYLGKRSNSEIVTRKVNDISLNIVIIYFIICSFNVIVCPQHPSFRRWQL